MNNKKLYVDELILRLKEYGFNGEIIEDIVDEKYCFYIPTMIWSISRSVEISKEINTHMINFCKEKNIENNFIVVFTY